MDIDARILVQVIRDTGVHVDVQCHADGKCQMTAQDGSGHLWQVTAPSERAAAEEIKQLLWYSDPE